MTYPAASTSELRRRGSLTGLQRSVLLTVLYADLFDFPLTEEELRERLILRSADAPSLRRCVLSLTGHYLAVDGPFIAWKGREHLIDLRRRRAAASEELWPDAERYADWLRRIPFVRMVAVSGSLAVGNAEPSSDVDLFCITEGKRLWLVRLFIVALSKMTRLFPAIFPRYLCPNYILASDAMEIHDRNLYTAYEVAQARPLHGKHTHADFLAANQWIHAFLPCAPTSTALQMDRTPSAPARVFEAVFGGRMGERLDEAICKAFRSFYRRRAERLGLSWARLENAYQRSRYTVPEGGYALVVQRLFLKRAEELLGRSSADDEVLRLFADDRSALGESCYDWEGQFRRDYGARDDFGVRGCYTASGGSAVTSSMDSVEHSARRVSSTRPIPPS